MCTVLCPLCGIRQKRQRKLQLGEKHYNGNPQKLCIRTFGGKRRGKIHAVAMELLLPDNILIEYQEYTTEQIARITGYGEELIRLRLK